MMGKKDFIADRSFLGKAINTSKRYSNIGPIVHTGKSQTSLLKSIHLKQLQEKQSETEYFSRIKPLAFAKLLYDTNTTTHDLLTLESTLQSTLSPKSTSHSSLGNTKDKFHDSVSPLLVDPDPSFFMSNQDGMYQRRIKNKWNGSAVTGYDPSLPYLLLDIREDQEWKKGHLVGALPYPSSLLKHDQFNRDLILFKNKNEKSIILYDHDESIAAFIAQLLVEKGFDNIFILSGGLKKFLSKIQGAFIGEYDCPSSTSISPNATTTNLQSSSMRFTSSPSLSHRPSSLLPKLPTLPFNSISPSSSSFSTSPSSSFLSSSKQPYFFDIDALEQSITKVTSSASSRASSRLSYRSTTESIRSTSRLSCSSSISSNLKLSMTPPSSFSCTSSRHSTPRSKMISTASTSTSSISRRGDSKRIHVS